MARVAKKLYFTVPGFGRIDAMPGGSFNTGGFNRQAVTADTRTVGYTEETSTPKLNFDLPVTSDNKLTPDVVASWKDIDVTVQDDLGNTYIFSDAWVTESPTQSDGKLPVTMEAMTAERV